MSHCASRLNSLCIGCTLSFSTLALVFIFGCSKKPDTSPIDPIKPKAAPSVSEIDLKSYRPNEAGAVMVVMYHKFDPSEPSSNRKLNRNPKDFRKDLQTLYDGNYRPVTLTEFLENRMDLPPGKTPIVLTFDDAAPSQFRLVAGSDGQSHIDPDCAVGILETFGKQHADWSAKGTFFVLPEAMKRGHMTPPPFGDPNSAADKLDYLVSKGYEIQNHSSTHPSFSRLTGEKVQEEIGFAVDSIRKIQPKAAMDILALPYGDLPKKDLMKYLLSGTGAGISYQNKAVIRAAWRPVASPVTKAGKKSSVFQVAPFDLMNIERVAPAPDLVGQQTFEYWLKWFEDNPSQRYVSDGNMAVVSVPKALVSLVDPDAVRRQGKVLQSYSLGGGAALGGGLSVEGSRSPAGGLNVEPSGVGAGK